MQLNAKINSLSHNQVVPGSSPGGTTYLEIESLYSDVEAFLFF